MSATIQEYFQNAQLSQASYAILNEGATNELTLIRALRLEQDDDYSVTQATLFAAHYDAIHSQQNTPNGFSATLFKDQSDVYTLAIWGIKSTIPRINIWKNAV